MFLRQTLLRNAVPLSKQPYQRCLMNMHTMRPRRPGAALIPLLQQRPLPGPVISATGSLASHRSFSVWRIPIYLATTTKLKRRLTMFGGLAGVTAIGALLGPAFWIALGGVATVVSWRVWRATSHWWQLINNNTPTTQAMEKQAKSLFQVLKQQVGSHRGADEVRQAAIEKIMQWAHTSQGHDVLLNGLNLDHIDDIDFYPAHAFASTSRTIVTDGQEHTERLVEVQFWAQDDRTPGFRGGSCCVYVDASVDSQGHISLKNIRLSAPGWHADEHVPLQQTHPTGRVVEGEFHNV